MFCLAVSFLETSGIGIALVCAALGLAFAFYLIKSIIASPAGNERMRQIAGAIQEGAKAYLGRQVRSIAVIAVVIAILVAIFKDGRDGGRVCPGRGLLAGGGFHRHAHRRHGQCAHRARRNDQPKESHGRRLQRRRGDGLARRWTGLAVGRRFLAGHERHFDPRKGALKPRRRRARRFAHLGLCASRRRHLHQSCGCRRGPRRQGGAEPR